MANFLRDNKTILKKEVFLSALGWSILGYVFIQILSLIRFYIGYLGIKSEQRTIMALSMWLFIAIPILVLGIIFYFALKKNWKKFKFVEYKYKFIYLSYIFILVKIFDYVLHLIFTMPYVLVQINLLSLAILFIIPGLIKKKANS